MCIFSDNDGFDERTLHDLLYNYIFYSALRIFHKGHMHI